MKGSDFERGVLQQTQFATSLTRLHTLKDAAASVFTFHKHQPQKAKENSSSSLFQIFKCMHSSLTTKCVEGDLSMVSSRIMRFMGVRGRRFWGSGLYLVINARQWGTSVRNLTVVALSVGNA